MADIAIVKEIAIELDGKSPFEYIVVKQGDKDSRFLSISLLENKQPYAIPAGCTARVKYYKPDGNPVLNDCEISGNKILMMYTEQMLAAAGTAKGEIVLLQDGKELKSATFYTKIVPAVYKTDGLISDKEFLSLAETVIKMEQAADAAEENARIAQNAAADLEAIKSNITNQVNNKVDTYIEENPLLLDATLADDKRAAPAGLVGSLTEDLSDSIYGDFVDTTKNYNIKNGFYRKNSGTYEDLKYGEATEIFDVKVGHKYLITLCYGADTAGICEFDANGTFIRSLLKTDASGYTLVTDYEYKVPAGVSKVAFGSFPISASAVKSPLVIKEKLNRLDDIDKKKDNPLYGKSMYYDGDSIAYGAGANGKGFGDLIAEKYNMQIDKFAVSGGTLSVCEPENRHNICSSVLENMKKEYDYMLLDGGYNDFGKKIPIGSLSANQSIPFTENPDKTTIVGALESIFQYVRRTYPKTQIFFLLTHKVKNYWTKPLADYGFTQKDVYEKIKECCERYSVKVIDVFNESGFCTYYDEHNIYTSNNDRIHPTLEGYNTFYIPVIEREMI